MKAHWQLLLPTALTLCASTPGSRIFIAVGSFDETHSWRRSLARRTYLSSLAPRRDYIFAVHSASALEIKEFNDVMLVPANDLSKCDIDARGHDRDSLMVYSKRCRSGATFAAGLRWATTYSTAPYILSIDDDGFLCTATLFRLVMSLQYQAGVVIGTWHPGGGSHPDQNFVLLSRDVASNASRRFDAIPRKKTLTVELASFLHSQVHAYDARNVVLHPKHNALARMYQHLDEAGRYFQTNPSPFCNKHLWVHLCCSSGGTPELWEQLHRGEVDNSSENMHVIKEALVPLSEAALQSLNFVWQSRMIKAQSCSECGGRLSRY